MLRVLLAILVIGFHGALAYQIYPRSANQCDGIITFDNTYVVTVHSSLPPSHVRLIEREDTTAEYTRWCYELQVNQENQTIQTIYGESSSGFDNMSEEEYPGVEFLDVDFNGYVDIKMFNARAANGVNAGYAIYLFDPKIRAFTYNDDFSSIFGGNYFELDPQKKEIFSAGELGCMGLCWSQDTYRVENGSLVLIKRVHQDQDDERPGKFILIREEMVNGKLTVISKERVE